MSSSPSDLILSSSSPLFSSPPSPAHGSPKAFLNHLLTSPTSYLSLSTSSSSTATLLSSLLPKSASPQTKLLSTSEIVSLKSSQGENEEAKINDRHTRMILSDHEVNRRTGNRIPYVELRELGDLEKKERKAIKEILGKEMREKCTYELDEYFDCMVERTFTFLRCKQYALKARKCLQYFERPEHVEKRMREIAEEREKSGESLLRRSERKYYNKYINDSDGSGWLPFKDN